MATVPCFSRFLPPSPPPPPHLLRIGAAPNRLAPRPPCFHPRPPARDRRILLRSSAREDAAASDTPKDSGEVPAGDEDKEKSEAAAAVAASSSSTVAELKELMAERRKREEERPPGLLAGVAEEVSEIEWPAFGRVLGTTGVVLAVIAGSSVALLTVNAVLTEISDRVFAGKGIQDFF